MFWFRDWFVFFDVYFVFDFVFVFCVVSVVMFWLLDCFFYDRMLKIFFDMYCNGFVILVIDDDVL